MYGTQGGHQRGTWGSGRQLKAHVGRAAEWLGPPGRRWAMSSCRSHISAVRPLVARGLQSNAAVQYVAWLAIPALSDSCFGVGDVRMLVLASHRLSGTALV